MHQVENPLPLWTGGIRCRCDAHRKQVNCKQLYNQVPQMVWSSWSPRQACSSSSRSESRSQRQIEGLGPEDPGWAAQQNEEEMLLWSEELGVNMWQSVPSPTHLSHITNITPSATLSRIKCERYIFLKKCFRSSLLLIIFPHVYVYV